MSDYDIVSDLTDETVLVNAGDVAADRGSDPVKPADAVSEPKPKTDVQTPATKPASLRDQISSVLKGEELDPDDGRVRNPDGTFAPKPAEPTVEGAVVPPVVAAPVSAPQGLTPQEYEVFTKLPAELQSSVARTMESLAEKTARFAGYEQLETLIAPRRQAWALNGVTEGQAINQLLALSDFAGRDPQGFVKYFVEQRGLSLEDITYDTDPVDPNLQALQNQVQSLTHQLSGVTTKQQQDQHTAVINEIVSFASEAGTDGNPLRPHFDELGNDIMPFISAAMQQNPNAPRSQILQDAYDRACWGSPTVRGKMQQAEQAAATARRIQEQQVDAVRARRAGSSVPSGVPVSSSAATSSVRSLRDEIRANLTS